MHYWDTSTLAKLYVTESDSPQFSAHWSQTGVITTSALARWELFCVLVRKETDGLIPPGRLKSFSTSSSPMLPVARLFSLR